MTRFLAALVRHGKYAQPPRVPSAHLPHGLTGEGVEQARQGADKLVALAVSIEAGLHPVLHASSLRRAWETAEHLADRLRDLTGTQFEIVQSDELTERSLGAAANLTMEEIQQAVEADPRYGEPLPEDWKSRPDFKLPWLGAESLLEAGSRAACYLEDASARHRGDEKTIQVFVGHGGAFRFAAVHLGALTKTRAPQLSMHHCEPVLIERLGPATWRQVGGLWKERRREVATGTRGEGRR